MALILFSFAFCFLFETKPKSKRVGRLLFSLAAGNGACTTKSCQVPLGSELERGAAVLMPDDGSICIL